MHLVFLFHLHVLSRLVISLGPFPFVSQWKSEKASGTPDKVQRLARTMSGCAEKIGFGRWQHVVRLWCNLGRGVQAQPQRAVR